MKKIYIDFDGVIVNTIKKIVDLYNEDFKYYKKFTPINWIDVESWDFVECECATSEYINTYFNQQRFFDSLEYMDNAKEILQELSNDYEIIIVSLGYSPNLRAKELWIKNNLPFCKFIGVNMKEYSNKSHIDMSDGIFIDDSIGNLLTSNAKEKICFGDEYIWNKDCKFIRLYNWNEVKQYLYDGLSLKEERRHMTKEEIEKALGYKIDIIEYNEMRYLNENNLYDLSMNY